MTRRLIQWLGLIGLLLFGFLAGHVRLDPLIRQTFTLDTSAHGGFTCNAVFPRQGRPFPVVIYAHAAGECLTNDDAVLDQLAELGLAAVSLDYDQTNHQEFQAQLHSLLICLNHQTWVKTNAMVWMGSSLGANHLLDQALRQTSPQPQILVLLSSQGLSGSFTNLPFVPYHGQVRLVQGERDEVFPWTNAEQLYLELKHEGVSADLTVIPGVGHGLEPYRKLIIRQFGEYSLYQLAGTNWWQNYHAPAEATDRPAAWRWWLLAVIWFAAWHRWSRRTKAPVPRPASGPPLSTGGRALAALLALWVVVVIFIYVITPQLAVNYVTAAIARHCIVPPAEREDFDSLVSQPYWNGESLQTYCEQIRWAGYVRPRFNLRGDAAIYREFCVSPFITKRTGEMLNWRPMLWAEFSPCLGDETDAFAAARLIVRHLGENITVVHADPSLPHDVAGIWKKRVTDWDGFGTICVAALRSVGIPARLDQYHGAEFWNGTYWESAPSPVIPAKLLPDK